MSRKFKVPIESDVPDGISPIVVDSSTLVSNLNADLLDGQEGSFYSPIESPTFTGVPSAPTPTIGNSTNQIATTEFVTAGIDAIESSVVYYQDDAPLLPEVGSIWVESDEVFSSFSSNDFILKSGGVFTGNINGTTASFTVSVSAPTAAALTNTTQLATTAFATAADNLKADRISEAITDDTISSNILTFDVSISNVEFVATAPTANFTVNLTNAPTTNGRAITVVAFIVQGATGKIPNVLQVAGVGQTIKWQGGTAPTPTSVVGKTDVFSFTLIRRSGTWNVFGSALLNF